MKINGNGFRRNKSEMCCFGEKKVKINRNGIKKNNSDIFYFSEKKMWKLTEMVSEGIKRKCVVLARKIGKINGNGIKIIITLIYVILARKKCEKKNGNGIKKKSDICYFGEKKKVKTNGNGFRRNKSEMCCFGEKKMLKLTEIDSEGINKKCVVLARKKRDIIYHKLYIINRYKICNIDVICIYIIHMIYINKEEKAK